MRPAILGVLMAALACVPANVAQRRPAPVQGYKIVATFPHDTTSFTQGLVFADGELYESTGLEGESTLRRVDITTGKTLRVQDAGRPIGNLNELEWIEGEIWANVWMTDRIARISPNTGEVNAWIDLASLWPVAGRPSPSEQVLNGIAYDKATRRIFITGKKWPRLYQISVGAGL